MNALQNLVDAEAPDAPREVREAIAQYAWEYRPIAFSLAQQANDNGWTTRADVVAKMGWAPEEAHCGQCAGRRALAQLRQA